MALAVYMIWRSICQGGIFSSVRSGLLVGAAWWTKYNGWLPLAIAICRLRRLAAVGRAAAVVRGR